MVQARMTPSGGWYAILPEPEGGNSPSCLMACRLSARLWYAIIPNAVEGGHLTIDRRSVIGFLGAAALAPSWVRAAPTRTIALLFDSLVSSFWVCATERLRREIRAQGWSG